MKTVILTLLFAILAACSSKKPASIPLPEAGVRAAGIDVKTRIIDWSDAPLKDCTAESVLTGGGKGPFLDASLLTQRLRKSTERVLVSRFTFHLNEAADALPWTLSSHTAEELTVVRAGNRCLVRFKGNLLAETELATAMDIWADVHSERGAIQFESRPRKINPFLPVTQGHPIPETLAVALRPTPSTLKYLSAIAGVSEAHLRPFVRWRASDERAPWGIHLRWNDKNQERSFYTSSQEGWVPTALAMSSPSIAATVKAEVLIPAPDARTRPLLFQFDIRTEATDNSGVRALITNAVPPQPAATDSQKGLLCFFQRWDALLKPSPQNELQVLKTLNMDELMVPCFAWDSRLKETLFQSEHLGMRLKNLIVRGLFRNPETRNKWSQPLLEYLKAQLDAGRDFAMQLDPERQDPTLRELFRSQTLLRAEVNQRPELLPSLDALENLFLKWALGGEVFEADTIAVFLLASERIGPELRGPFFRLMENSSRLFVQSPEIEFALRMKPDLRELIESSRELALQLGWDEWISSEFENVFVHRRAYSHWRGQYEFLETLNQVFKTGRLGHPQKKVIAETIVQTFWKSKLELSWRKETTARLATQLQLLYDLFPKTTAAWLEKRKTKGLTNRDLGILQIADAVHPEHVRMWKEVQAGAERLGVGQAFENIGSALFKGERTSQQTLFAWSELEANRFRAWIDLVSPQSLNAFNYVSRLALIEQPERWAKISRWDSSLHRLSEITAELQRWQPESSFLPVQQELIGALVNRPETLWSDCEPKEVSERVDRLTKEMRIYRDHFGGTRSTQALQNLRETFAGCQSSIASEP